MKWTCGAHLFEDAPIIVGILNVTPDSFSDGGRHNTLEAAVEHAELMRAQGAAVIDVGGESTRPGSGEVPTDEELARIIPVVAELAGRGFCVSVDTRHAQVAQAALEVGASIINDVSGFRDEEMRRVVAASGCGVIVMHMQGEPKTMQVEPHYTDVVAEVGEYLLAQAAQLEALGVARERIMLDPGPGFGKTAVHTRTLVEATSRLVALGYPLMAAVSRKSFIGALTGIGEPAERDEASALCAASMAADGAFALRVHDVAATAAALEKSRRAFVALGSNIGDGAAQLDAAVDALRRTPGIWVARVSSYYLSEPAYKEDQERFTNAVAELRTTLGPCELLDKLHRIENAHGRVRHEANGPRTLDLDILDYEGVVSSDPVLTLPHPRVLERDFTVTPLLEIVEDDKPSDSSSSSSFVFADGKPLTRDHIAYGICVERLARKA